MYGEPNMTVARGSRRRNWYVRRSYIHTYREALWSRFTIYSACMKLYPLYWYLITSVFINGSWPVRSRHAYNRNSWKELIMKNNWPNNAKITLALIHKFYILIYQIVKVSQTLQWSDYVVVLNTCHVKYIMAWTILT